MPQKRNQLKLKMVTLPETNSSHLKMDDWNTFSFPFGVAYFQVRLLLVLGSVNHVKSLNIH